MFTIKITDAQTSAEFINLSDCNLTTNKDSESVYLFDFVSPSEIPYKVIYDKMREPIEVSVNDEQIVSGKLCLFLKREFIGGFRYQIGLFNQTIGS